MSTIDIDAMLLDVEEGMPCGPNLEYDPGFVALEQLLAESPDTGSFCHGEQPGLADCCLVPQLYNARRFGVDLQVYPTLERIERACLALPAFEAARPENQPDAQ